MSVLDVDKYIVLRSLPVKSLAFTCHAVPECQRCLRTSSRIFCDLLHKDGMSTVTRQRTRDMEDAEGLQACFFLLSIGYMHVSYPKFARALP